MSRDILRRLATPPQMEWWEGGNYRFNVIRTLGREVVCVVRCVIMEWVPRWINCYDFFIYIPYINFKLFLDHIISLWLPQKYLNSHNCSFDINIVKISTIWSLHVGTETAAFMVNILTMETAIERKRRFARERQRRRTASLTYLTYCFCLTFSFILYSLSCIFSPC